MAGNMPNNKKPPLESARIAAAAFCCLQAKNAPDIPTHDHLHLRLGQLLAPRAGPCTWPRRCGLRRRAWTPRTNSAAIGQFPAGRAAVSRSGPAAPRRSPSGELFVMLFPGFCCWVFRAVPCFVFSRTYPLIPVIAIPSTKYFCRNTYSTRMGITEITEPAISRFQAT